MPKDTRLIERWLPIAELGIEVVPRATPMTRVAADLIDLHVWWARRPLIASRAAILASILPADADHEKFFHVLGIHGDPVARRRSDWTLRIETENDCAPNPYGYDRAFQYRPSAEDMKWIERTDRVTTRSISHVLRSNCRRR